MRQVFAGATNRSLTYVALSLVVVILGIQGVIFAIWGNEGDPPNGVVAVAFVLFWGSVLGLVVVIIEAIRRRRGSRRPSN